MIAVDVRGGACGACGGALMLLEKAKFLLCLACGDLRDRRDIQVSD